MLFVSRYEFRLEFESKIGWEISKSTGVFKHQNKTGSAPSPKLIAIPSSLNQTKSFPIVPPSDNLSQHKTISVFEEQQPSQDD